MKIAIGRYVHGNSIIHRLDARLKLFANVSFIVLLFMANNFILQGLLTFPLMVAFIIATKKPGKLLKMFIFPLWIGLCLFIINCFFLDTSLKITSDLGNNPITIENFVKTNWININNVFKINYIVLATTINIMIRVYSIILAMTLLTLSTPPILLTKALDWYFTPLKIIKIPTHIFIMIISVALRFIPTLVDESQRILKAQASRGVDFKNGGFRMKIKASIVLIIPLFVSAFSKAEDLSNAMETRGYNPYEKRTSYVDWKFWWFDVIALFCVFSIVILTAIILNGSVFTMPGWWLVATNVF